MTTIGLSYSLVKISTKCAPALIDNGHEKQELISLIKTEKAFKNKLESINMSCIL